MGETNIERPGGTNSVKGRLSGTTAVKEAQALWTPTQLGTDLEVWADRWNSEIQARTSGGNEYATRVEDVSGGGHDLAQSTADKQPRVELDSLFFDGVNDYIETNHDLVGEKQTVVALLKILGGQRIIHLDADATLFTNGNYQYYFGSDSVNNFISVGAWDVITLRYDGYDSLTIRVNGADAIITGPADSYDSTLLTLFADTNDDEHTEGYWSGVVRTAGVHAEILEGWLAWLADRNGISRPAAELPDSHPYSDGPPQL